MKTAGVVLDFYDDVTGAILKEAFPSPDDLPEIVKQAHILNPEEREILRDEAYALVMQNEGRVLRKFACVDRGNTLLSAIYFEKNAELLPEEAREIARANIAFRLKEYGFFDEQEKTAAAKGEDKKGSNMGKVRDSLQQPLVGDEADWAARTNLVSVRGGADSGRVIPAANQIKTANVPKGAYYALTAGRASGKSGPAMEELAKRIGDKYVGSMNLRGRILGTGSVTSISRKAAPAMRKAAMVDVSGKEPAPRVLRKEAQRTALDGKYPLDSYADVRAAVEYFKDNWPEFDPPERHEFCVKVAARADQIGIDMPEVMQRYGSTAYAPDIEAHLSQRKLNCSPDFHGVYDAMKEKKAELEPEQFAELLAHADIASGLNWSWGGQVQDPWYSTFGGRSEHEKVAFAWEGGGYAVDANALQEAAASGVLKGSFNDDIVKAFEKDPVTIFESLPDDTKTLIARLATEA